MRLEDTQEHRQSIKMRPACNRVLSEVFGVCEQHIIRYEQAGGVHVLDQEFGIDLKIVLPSGGQLSGQEKALSNKFAHYRTFTIEFFQNRNTGEPGEFFKIASQFYLSGYSDQSGVEFKEWHIIKVFDFINWLRSCCVDKLKKKCKPAYRSRASFLPIPYSKIPKEHIFASGTGPRDTYVHYPIETILVPLNHA